jgi:spore maturation protein CgeB
MMSSRLSSRILFVGPLWQGSTCLSRLDGLRTLGLEIDCLDTTHWLPPGPRLLRSIVQRTYVHRSVRRMNLRLRALLQQTRYDVVWIEKGEWIYPWTLSWVRRQGCGVIHYSTDDILGRYGHFWLHRMGIRNYDLYLTTNRWNVAEIRDRYGIKIVRAGMGFDSAFCHPIDVSGLETLDVVFVGHWEPHTEDYIMALRNAGVDVQVWGYNWWKARNAGLRRVKPLPYADYASTIARAKMALCSLSHWNRNESTGRSFEIPAIGTMMLAEYTPEHEFIYGDGKGAVLFSNLSELVEKARYYLDNPAARKAIAIAGQAISKEPGHSWTDHIRREWPVVERMLAPPGSMPVDDDDAPFWKGFRNGAPPSQAGKRIGRTDG